MNVCEKSLSYLLIPQKIYSLHFYFLFLAPKKGAFFMLVKLH